jgi:hypothetical protein
MLGIDFECEGCRRNNCDIHGPEHVSAVLNVLKKYGPDGPPSQEEGTPTATKVSRRDGSAKGETTTKAGKPATKRIAMRSPARGGRGRR